jgi:Domain of unknown function (DUF4189)
MKQVGRIRIVGLAGATVATGLLCAAPAHAEPGWVAVAKSPLRESLDWAGGLGHTRFSAEAEALRQCAVLQRASDCAVLASGPNCVAVAWDAAQPLNLAYGAVGDTPAAAINAAVATAGPFANDPSVRCSYATYSPGAY